MGIALHQIKEIGRWGRLVRNGFGSSRGKDKVVVVIILEEIYEGAYVRVPLNDLAFNPSIVRIRVESSRMPRSRSW